jgi:chromosomal replication initiator protein
MYLARELLNANLVEIANEFGRKDHTTVLNACDNVKKKMETDASTRSSVSEIKRRLEQIG